MATIPKDEIVLSIDATEEPIIIYLAGEEVPEEDQTHSNVTLLLDEEETKALSVKVAA